MLPLIESPWTGEMCLAQLVAIVCLMTDHCRTQYPPSLCYALVTLGLFFLAISCMDWIAHQGSQPPYSSAIWRPFKYVSWATRHISSALHFAPLPLFPALMNRICV